MRGTVPILAFAWVCGCGDNHAPKQANVADLQASEAGQVVVATVNGRAVLGGCISEQIAITQATANEALETCIEFELLAQAAARFLNDPEVIETRRRESVRVLVDREFKPTADEPSDVPSDFIQDRVWKQPAVRAEFIHGEYRRWAHALAPISKASTADDRAKAKSLAQEWEREFRGKAGITAAQFAKAVARIAGSRPHKFESASHRQLHVRSGTVKPFADALFAMPTPMQTSSVVETRFGYHVILLLAIEPPENRDFAQALPELQQRVYKKWRALAFEEWATAKVKNSTDPVIRYENIDDALARVAVNVGGVAIGSDVPNRAPGD